MSTSPTKSHLADGMSSSDRNNGVHRRNDDGTRSRYSRNHTTNKACVVALVGRSRPLVDYCSKILVTKVPSAQDDDADDDKNDFHTTTVAVSSILTWSFGILLLPETLQNPGWRWHAKPFDINNTNSVGARAIRMESSDERVMICWRTSVTPAMDKRKWRAVDVGSILQCSRRPNWFFQNSHIYLLRFCCCLSLYYRCLSGVAIFIYRHIQLVHQSGKRTTTRCISGCYYGSE